MHITDEQLESAHMAIDLPLFRCKERPEVAGLPVGSKRAVHN